MTTASKIHRQAVGKPDGTTVCGRKASPGRITDDPDDVTCDVCIITTLRQGGASAPRPTVMDRHAEARGDLPNLARGANPALDAALDAAFRTLAARHFEEFLELYRAELSTTK